MTLSAELGSSLIFGDLFNLGGAPPVKSNKPGGEDSLRSIGRDLLTEDPGYSHVVYGFFQLLGTGLVANVFSALGGQGNAVSISSNDVIA